MSLIIAPAQLSAAETKTADVKQTGSAKAGPKDYQIGAGDILEITIWKEPDLSREAVLVRTDGKISFPLLSDVQAAGLTPPQLKLNMEAGLKDYVESPFVTITVRNPASKKFYVLGEVLNTGEYPLVKHLTVLQAFAVAGGFTEWANKELTLVREKVGGQGSEFFKGNTMEFDYDGLISGKDMCPIAPPRCALFR